MARCYLGNRSGFFSPTIPARKTIMAGLLINELLIRGDLHRCMIVCPSNLAEQWQDELYQSSAAIRMSRRS